MELTEKQIELIKNKLKVRSTCPNCGSGKEALVSNEVYHLAPFTSTNNVPNFNSDFSYQPLLSVKCPNCGYVMLFDLSNIDPEYIQSLHL